MRISIIAAVAQNRVIGSKADLPWRLPDDMKFFSQTTRGHHVLMGRKNYHSIPKKYRPLPQRTNLIVTHDTSFSDEAIHVFNSINSAIEFARMARESELFIIGGGNVYEQTIALCDRMYITHVHGTPEGDTFFPVWNDDEWNRIVISDHSADAVHNYPFTICRYDRK